MAVQSALVVLVRASLRGSDQMVRPAALSWCPLPYSCKRYTYMSCNVPATRTARHRYFLRFQRFPTLFQLFPSKKQGSNAKPPKRCPSAAHYRLNTRNLASALAALGVGGNGHRRAEPPCLAVRVGRVASPPKVDPRCPSDMGGRRRRPS